MSRDTSTSEGGTSATPPLAVVVPKEQAEAAIAALEAEGVYDDDRKVREHRADPDAVELPVTAPPRETAVEAVVTGATEPRRRGLASRLRERGWREGAIEAAPSSWAVVGDVVLVDLSGLDRERWAAVGSALADLHGAVTVCHRAGIEGPHREPDVTVVHGERTRTVHVEDGTAYGLDLSRVMFSPGNQAERRRMGALVGRGEAVLDLFAGIGYFALPMALAGAAVTAVERNPTAQRFLVENVHRNGVTDRLATVCGDCRAVAGDVSRRADRVMLGHFNATAYLPTAVGALDTGGRLHLHDVVPGDGADDTREPPEAAIERAAAAADRRVVERERRVVKSFSEGLDHVVVDATLG